MSMTAESDDLWNEAMALLLAWQARPDDEAVREDVRRFCALGNDHRAAWEEAKKVYRLAGSAVAEKRVGQRRRVTRRQALAGVGALGLIGAGALFGPGLWQRWRADYTTRAAEIRRIQLPDGSWLTLGPESAVDIAFSERLRWVNVLDGMALCEVAPELRPFEAHTGDLRATALGTRFELRQNGGRSVVGVEEGTVEVIAGAEAATLHAGDWLASGPGSGNIERGHRDAGQTAAWRQKLLVAERDPVGAVVAEIARWRTGEVFIADPGLSSVPVSGLYDLQDPNAALAAVVAPYGGKVRHVSPWITVLSRI